MKKHILIVILLVSAVFVAGCETVKGVGRDITGASSTIQEQMSGSGRAQR